MYESRFCFLLRYIAHIVDLKQASSCALLYVGAVSRSHVWYQFLPGQELDEHEESAAISEVLVQVIHLLPNLERRETNVWPGYNMHYNLMHYTAEP